MTLRSRSSTRNSRRDYDVVIDEARAVADLAPGLSLATSYEGRALALTGQGTACLALELGVYDLVRAICLHTAGREAEAAQHLASYYGLVGDAPSDVDFADAVVEVHREAIAKVAALRQRPSPTPGTAWPTPANAEWLLADAPKQDGSDHRPRDCDAVGYHGNELIEV